MPDELKRLTEDLGREVHGLREELAHDRKDRQADRRRDWTRLLVILGALVLVAAAALGGAYYLIQENNRKWCGTLTIIADPTGPPPTNDRGRVVVERLQVLAENFGCELPRP